MRITNLYIPPVKKTKKNGRSVEGGVNSKSTEMRIARMKALMKIQMTAQMKMRKRYQWRTHQEKVLEAE